MAEWLHDKCTEGQPALTGSLKHNKAKDTGISYRLQLNMNCQDQTREVCCQSLSEFLQKLG